MKGRTRVMEVPLIFPASMALDMTHKSAKEDLELVA